MLYFPIALTFESVLKQDDLNNSTNHDEKRIDFFSPAVFNITII